MKTRTRLIFTIGLLLSVLLVTQQACKKENESPPPPDNEEPSIPETTKVISNNDWNENIISIDSTNWTLTFKKELSYNNPVSVGDIVVNANGQGLLRKISEIKEEGGNLIVSTVEATIVEALPKGRVEFNIDLTQNFKDAEILYMAEGVELMSGKKDGNDRIVLAFSLDQELADQVTISGVVSIAPTFSGTVVWEGPYPDTVIIQFTVNEELEISAAVNLAILKLEKEIVLVETPLPSFTIPAAIPIVVTPVLQLVLGANIDVKSKVKTGVKQEINFDAGFKYLNGDFNTFCELSKNLEPIPPELSNTLKAKAYVKPKIDMKLYQMVSPSLSMQLYESLEAELGTNPWWKLYAGLSGDVGFKIGKWGFEIVDINANLFNNKVPIDSAMTADFIANITNGSAPLTVNFTDQSTKDPTSWQWDFGDGSTSTEQNPSYTYNSNGSYTVTLTATNGNGSNVKTKPNYIVVSEGGGDTPIANFTADITSGEAPITVNFTDQSENNPTTWQWDFGNGGTSSQQNPSYTYNTAGTYTVTLTATNEYGADTDTKTNYITVIGTGYTFTDPRDGQTYNTVEIGSQEWFAENLNYVTDNSWCYDNDGNNCDIYGRLYDWDAALTACPAGWHLPSDDEWKTLEMYLGMSQSEADQTGYRGTDEGGKIKGTTLWLLPNTGATNSSGFTALPGGKRFASGPIEWMGSYTAGGWWSSSEYLGTHARFRSLYYNSEQVYRDYDYKENGYSVRCVKN